MEHIVYRAINRPIRLLRVDWWMLFACFFVGATVLTYCILFRINVIFGVLITIALYAVCRAVTTEDPMHPLLLIEKYRQKQILDPVARSTKPRTQTL